jgi:hypothetical protein
MASENRPVWILVIGILAIVLVAGALAVSAVERATRPAAELSGAVATQVAQLLHPTPTIIPDPVTIVQQVRPLARLETIQYSVEKIITGQVNQGALEFLFGDRLLFVAHGRVIAGIDLSQLQDQDVLVDSAGVRLYLPPAEIFVATLDNQKSYVFDRTTGLLQGGDPGLETAVRQIAEQQIRQAALEDGILEQAQTNGEAYLYRLLRSLGLEGVTIESRPHSIPTPVAAPGG